MERPIGLLTGRPSYEDAGLLALRLICAGSLFLKHGIEKVVTFSAMAQHFPDPIHIGPAPSLFIAMLGDFVCGLLLIVGLGTRWAAIFSFMNIFVAWSLVHHFVWVGHGPLVDHGESIVLYLGVMIALALAGAGRYSLDYVLGHREPKAVLRPAY